MEAIGGTDGQEIGGGGGGGWFTLMYGLRRWSLLINALLLEKEVLRHNSHRLQFIINKYSWKELKNTFSLYKQIEVVMLKMLDYITDISNFHMQRNLLRKAVSLIIWLYAGCWTEISCRCLLTIRGRNSFQEGKCRCDWKKRTHHNGLYCRIFLPRGAVYNICRLVNTTQAN